MENDEKKVKKYFYAKNTVVEGVSQLLEKIIKKTFAIFEGFLKGCFWEKKVK